MNRDITHGKNASRVRTGTVPAVTADLLNLASILAHLDGAANRAA